MRKEEGMDWTLAGRSDKPKEGGRKFFNRKKKRHRIRSGIKTRRNQTRGKKRGEGGKKKGF